MLLSDVICVTAVVLELITLLLLRRKGLWRIYPLFSIYTAWLLAGNSVILFTFIHWPSIYAAMYWTIDSVDVALRFIIVWEVFHQIFPKGSALNKSLSKGLGAVASGLLVFACAMFLAYQRDTGPRAIHLALDRSFGVVQAVMILGILLMARYYGVKCGRNVRGIAIAFGAWVSISTATNAMADLTSSFLPYWYYLRPLSFVVMIVVWIWAVSVYEPNPPILESEAPQLEQWTEDWNRTISAARTIIRP